MISVEEAQKYIVEHVQPLSRETISIVEAVGRVLAEDVVATRMLPAWDNSAMDGYALMGADLQDTNRVFDIVASIPAGEVAEREIPRGRTGLPHRSATLASARPWRCLEFM